MQVPEKGDFASAGVVEGDEIVSVNGISLRLGEVFWTFLVIYFSFFFINFFLEVSKTT